MNRKAFAPAALWSLAKDSVSAWSRDFAPSMGAGLAYYTVFSLAPLLVIVIAIAGVLFDADAASDYVYAQIGGLLGDEGARAIRSMADRASASNEGLVATALGVGLLIVGATSVFGELQSDLDRIWKAPAAKGPEGLWGLVRSRLLSLGLVVSIGFLLLVSLVVSAALAALGKWWGGWLGQAEWLLHALDLLVSLAVITGLFALIYKILPRVKIGWHDVWIGALATALLFTVGKFLLGLYIGKSEVASGFGAAGSLVIVMVWVYYSAQILLLGAEFTWVYAHRFGSRRGLDESDAGADAGAARPVKKAARPRLRRVGSHTAARLPDARVTAGAADGALRRHRFAAGGVAIATALLIGWLVYRPDSSRAPD